MIGIGLAVPYATVAQSATTGDADASLALTGNRTASDAGADVLVGSVVTRTAGDLLRVQNNGTTKASVDYLGNITAPSFVGPVTGAVTGNVTGNVSGNVSGQVTVPSGGSVTISTGVGSVKLSTANAATNTVWIPITYASTTYYVPGWTTNAPG